MSLATPLNIDQMGSNFVWSILFTIETLSKGGIEKI